MGWFVCGVASMVFLLDQSTKSLAIRFLSVAHPATAGGQGLLSLEPNRRWWFGRAPAAGLLLGLWGLALGSTALAIGTNPDLASNAMASAGLVAAAAGATSNLCDRLGRGAVIDFIALGRWPAFNLADVAIVAGVALAVGSVL
ncbi:MAG TPA: signal peptidase II [Solirubrobacteraceae bacterium]|jgi:signal peptidase II